MNVKIFITNLAKYNEGALVGKWVELPLDEDDLKYEIKTVLNNDEEYFISDYEAPFSITEYCDPFKINNQAQQIDNLQQHEKEALEILIKTERYDSIEEAIDALKSGNHIFYKSCYDMKDVVRFYIDMVGGGLREAIGNLERYIEIPEHYEKIEDMSEDSLERNFDIDQYIVDIEIENDYEYVGNGVYVQFLN